MSVVIETTLGNITVDLFLTERPRACLNFLKLCKLKYYNYNLFHTIIRDFIAQTGDPTGSRNEGQSVYGVIDGPSKRFFVSENEPKIKHTKMGLISFVGNQEHMIGSQFFLTLGEDLTYLDEKHCVFGEVVEGFDILEMINEVICDTDNRPYQDVRITHTVILDDPYPDPKKLIAPSRSPSPNADRLQGGRIAPDEEINEMEGRPPEEIAEIQADREAKARATILEMVGDLPHADMAPPENVLFVCKLNPVTTDDDLEIIFSRFGKIKSCEVIRDKKTGDSLQYAFVEFEEQKSCETAYFKMDNVLIDDRRIHVDFSQSVSKVKWHGRGRGVTHYDDRGKKTNENNYDIGKGNYKIKRRDTNYARDVSRDNSRSYGKVRENSASPSRDKGSRKHRDIPLSPKRSDRDFSSSKGSRLRNDKGNVKYSSKNNAKYNDRTRTSTPPLPNNYSRSSRRDSKSRSPGTDRNKSRNGRYKSPFSKNGRDNWSSTSDRRSETVRRYRSKSRSPRRGSSTKNNFNHTETSRYSRTGTSNLRVASSREKKSRFRSMYSPERTSGNGKSKMKLKNKRSSSEIDPRKEITKQKKRKYSSSEDSESDSDSSNGKKARRVKKYSTTSSTSEDDQKKKLKKKKKSAKVKKSRKKDSESDSDGDSDSDKKAKQVEKHTSSSSESEDYQKKSKKRKSSKKKKNSNSSSKDYQVSKSKKKKKKYE